MDSQPTDPIKPGPRPTNWIVTAAAGGIGIAGVAFALVAFALRSQHLVFSSRTLFAILGLIFLFGTIMAALVKRLAHDAAEPTTPQSTKPNEGDETDALTRRVRLLRGNDDL
jgi:hypothetical protein